MKLTKFTTANAITLGNYTGQNITFGELTSGPEGIAVKTAKETVIVPWANVTAMWPAPDPTKK